MADIMQGLSSSARLLILAKLEEGPASVTEIVDATGLAQATISNHLRLLRHLNLVTPSRSGRSVIYSLADDHVRDFLREAVHHVGHA